MSERRVRRSVRQRKVGGIAITKDGPQRGKTVAYISDPMASTQRTLGVPPVDQREHYQRQVRAQQLGGFRPLMYNWLVVGGQSAPLTMPLSDPIARPSIESAAKDPDP